MPNNHYNKDLREYARELRTTSISKAEKRIWKVLLSRKQMGVSFKRQRPIHHFIVDFFSQELKLIIEIDGNSHFNTGSYDRYREETLTSLGYHVVRYTEGEVMHQLDEVRLKLNRVIEVLKSSPCIPQIEVLPPSPHFGKLNAALQRGSDNYFHRRSLHEKRLYR